MADKAKPSFDQSSLKDSQKADFLFVQSRILELQGHRSDHYGQDLDSLWAQADEAYIPHRLKKGGRKALAEDETKGWRGTSSIVELGSSTWQSDVAHSNPFIKIQTALSILVDQNPGGVFTATTKKYQATTELIKQLYQRSWEYAKSKSQLKLFVYNLAKYGFAIARTYPLRITRKVKVLSEYNEENPEDSVYEEKEIVEYNDIFRENLDPRNAWLDDMAKPNNVHSIRDWSWRKVYAFDTATEEFGKYKNWKFVQPGGVTDEVLNVKKNGKNKNIQTKDLVEVYFYENRLKDLFMVIANGVPVIIEPLPIADSTGLKKLSCWQAYWNLRHAESPYGVGIYEAIRYDQGILDRIRNMTIDQLTLSIYKMFFYSGTQALTDTGNITISPGVGKQALDPKNITFLEIPGPGKDAYDGIAAFKHDVDEASGIGDPLLGIPNENSKTAFELAQNKEAALKRLKDPLDNILEALNIEGYITTSLIQMLYSVPETFKVTDPELVNAYLQEVGSDPDLYERDDEGTFTAKVFREFPLNLDEDEEGNLTETQESQFFRVKPKFLQWEGIINIKAQSLLTPSKQIDKTLELEMYNMLIPLLQPMPNPMTGMDDKPLTYGKIAKSIVKLYEKDPKEILPDSWLQDPQEMMMQQQQDQPLIIPADGSGAPVPGAPQAPTPAPGGAGGAPKAVSTTQPSPSPTGIANKIMGKLSSPFKKV